MEALLRCQSLCEFVAWSVCLPRMESYHSPNFPYPISSNSNNLYWLIEQRLLNILCTFLQLTLAIIAASERLREVGQEKELPQDKVAASWQETRVWRAVEDGMKWMS